MFGVFREQSSGSSMATRIRDEEDPLSTGPSAEVCGSISHSRLASRLISLRQSGTPPHENIREPSLDRRLPQEVKEEVKVYV